MAKKRKKKTLESMLYASGGTKNSNYIELPGEELNKNNIALAEAQYQGSMNPAYLGLTAASTLIPQIGNQFFAGGGKMKYPTGGSVEIEGQEVLETPQGDVMKAEGPSHENGGIDLNLEEGTKIYSKRLKKMGKSMADRKLERENQLTKIQKRLDKNPTDKLLMKTYKSTKDSFDKIDAKDVAEMDALRNEMNMFQTGGVYDPYKTPYTDFGEEGYEYDNTLSGQENDIQARQAYGGFDVEGNSQRPSFFPPTEGPENFRPANIPFIDSYKDIDVNQFDEHDSGIIPRSVQPFQTGQAERPQQSIQYNQNPISVQEPDTSKGFGVNAGDILGLAGQAYNTFNPLIQANRNRANDTTNPNFFKDFGEDALATNTQAQNLAKQTEANQLQDVQLSANSAIRRGRNSARGVNTQRALDIATTTGVNKARRDVRSGTRDTLTNLLTQRSGLQNQRDQVQSQGAQQSDIANRQDQAAYESERSSAQNNIGLGLQNIGRTFNQIKSNNAGVNAINQTYDNFNVDGRGNVTGVQGQTRPNESRFNIQGLSSSGSKKLESDLLRGNIVERGGQYYDTDGNIVDITKLYR